jgi:hypothetical protein
VHIESVEIASRFRGPPNSGNGGYVCGCIAKHLRGTISVRLKAPPPLNAEMRLESDASIARLFHGTTLIGEAKCVEIDLSTKPTPTYDLAEAAVRSFVGFKTHRFPGCFVCGPERTAGDGMRIFPGPLAGNDVLASPWVPDASLAGDGGYVATEFLWSALDCPSGFAVLPLPDGVAIVLGELCASVTGSVRPGERCVVTAWPLGVEGRKRFSASAVHSEQGELVAVARAVWIEVPSSAWSAHEATGGQDA